MVSSRAARTPTPSLPPRRPAGRAAPTPRRETPPRLAGQCPLAIPGRRVEEDQAPPPHRTKNVLQPITGNQRRYRDERTVLRRRGGRGGCRRRVRTTA